MKKNLIKNMMKTLAMFFGIAVFGVISPAAKAMVISGNFVPGSGSWTTIPNGGFETGLSGWTQFNFGQGNFLGSTNAFAGNGSAKSSPSFSVNNFGFALQSSYISVTPGETYVFSGFINAANVRTGQVYIDLSDTSFDVNLGISEIVKGENNWQFVSVNFVPNVSSIKVRLVQDAQVTAGDFALYDEIGITLARNFTAPTVNAVPSPSTLSLLLPLLGFMGYRKIRHKNRLYDKKDE